MDDLKSTSSTALSSDAQAVPYAHFKPMDIYIFTFFYGLKLRAKPFVDFLVILIYFIQSFQWIMLLFKRPDINSMGIPQVMMVIGFFYVSSFIILMVFVDII
jgi:hypothetical protein